MFHLPDKLAWRGRGEVMDSLMSHLLMSEITQEMTFKYCMHRHDIALGGAGDPARAGNGVKEKCCRRSVLV